MRSFNATKPRYAVDTALMTATSLIATSWHPAIILAILLGGAVTFSLFGLSLVEAVDSAGFNSNLMQDVVNNPDLILTESEQYIFTQQFSELQALLELYGDDLATFLALFSTYDLSIESSVDLINFRDHLVTLSEQFELRIFNSLSEIVRRFQDTYSQTLFFDEYLHLSNLFRNDGDNLRSAIGLIDDELTRRNPGHISADLPWFRD